MLIESQYKKDLEYISNINILIKEKQELEKSNKLVREESDKHKGILKSINDEFKNSLALDDPRSR